MALADKTQQSDANNLPRLAAVCECANGRRRHIRAAAGKAPRTIHKMVLTSSRGASGCSECDASRPFYHHRGQCSFIQTPLTVLSCSPPKITSFPSSPPPEFCLNKISEGAIFCQGRAISSLQMNLESEIYIYIYLRLCSGALPRQDLLDTRRRRT